jgi:hypothetical protein
MDAAWHRAWNRRAFVEVREIGGGGDELNGLWERVRDQLSFSVVRDETWVRWRYGQAPHRRYRVFLAEADGVPRGFAALALPGEGSSRRAVIPEIFTAPDDTAAVRGLVGRLAAMAFLEGADTLVALTVPETWLDRALGDLGFLFSPGAFDVACVRLDSSLSLAALRRRDAWALAGGDFDIV